MTYVEFYELSKEYQENLKTCSPIELAHFALAEARDESYYHRFESDHPSHAKVIDLAMDLDWTKRLYRDKLIALKKVYKELGGTEPIPTSEDDSIVCGKLYDMVQDICKCERTVRDDLTGETYCAICGREF